MNALANDGFLKGGIDDTLVLNDDGSVYYTSNSGGNNIYLMNDDLSAFVGESHRITYEKPADGKRTRGGVGQKA